jgi:hypothetical protein
MLKPAQVPLTRTIRTPDPGRPCTNEVRPESARFVTSVASRFSDVNPTFTASRKRMNGTGRGTSLDGLSPNDGDCSSAAQPASETAHSTQTHSRMSAAVTVCGAIGAQRGQRAAPSASFRPGRPTTPRAVAGAAEEDPGTGRLRLPALRRRGEHRRPHHPVRRQGRPERVG